MDVSAWCEWERLRNKRGWTSMSHRFFPWCLGPAEDLTSGFFWFAFLIVLGCAYQAPELKKTSVMEAFEIHEKKAGRDYGEKWKALVIWHRLLIMMDSQRLVTQKPLCTWRIRWIILIQTHGPNWLNTTSLRASPGLYLGCHRTLGRYFWSEA